MNIPRWFFALLALCAIAITADVVWRSRYVIQGNHVTDLWLHEACYRDTCVHLGVRPVSPIAGFEDLVPKGH